MKKFIFLTALLISGLLHAETILRKSNHNEVTIELDQLDSRKFMMMLIDKMNFNTNRGDLNISCSKINYLESCVVKIKSQIFNDVDQIGCYTGSGGIVICPIKYTKDVQALNAFIKIPKVDYKNDYLFETWDQMFSIRKYFDSKIGEGYTIRFNPIFK